MTKKFLVLILGLTLVSCNSNKSTNSNKGDNSLVFETTTSLALLQNMNTSPVNLARREANKPSESEITELKDILVQLDIILQNDSNFKVESFKSDRSEYTYKDIVTFKNFDNEETTYSLYYSSVKEKFKEDKYDDEIEESTTINGIAIFNEEEYRFVSKNVKEIEDDEVEESTTFTMYKGENTHIKITQEYEQEYDEIEKYYSYKIVENGSKNYEYVLDYERENFENESEINLKINNQKYKIKEVIIEQETYLQVKYAETGNDSEDSNYKVLLKRIVSEINGVSSITYEIVE